MAFPCQARQVNRLVMANNLRSAPLSSTAALTLRPLGQGEERLWDAFVDTRSDASLYHRSPWRKLIHDLFGHETLYLYAVNAAGDWVGILPVVRLRSRLFGDYMVSMPYVNYGGALGLTAEIEAALMQEAGQSGQTAGVSHIEFRDSVGRAGAWKVRTDKVVMELTLPATHDELWNGFNPKLRAQIRRPQREQTEVIHGGAELLSQFYGVFARNMRDLGTPVYGQAFFAAIMAAFPASAHIVIVRHGQQPVAAAFLLGHRDRMEIPWASSLREYNQLGVNMLLYWEALQRAIAGGYKTFDFGRSSIDSGTYRFKKQWGAQPRQLYWHYWLAPGQDLPELTPSSPKYQLAIRAWKRLPLFLANRLGPHIVKNLP